ncbi:hypothetical protein GCM10027445_48480 [Amycolatopsis endophytica]|uniref:SAM-dependent methyltransferase n=1 Tax=Amycolatopsis endophytica TaxID=860233 RepID=A0A853BFB2_9PSEU|nr:class I SAM-dependent methyltransferase [Amycolatopsis endophytica]NYI93362.1 SAM-dependent methyltransferase [Amycolatopsis endophytica]
MSEDLRRLGLAGLGAMTRLLTAARTSGTAEEFGQALRVAPRHVWLLERWLLSLTGAGVFSRHGAEYRFTVAPEPVERGELAEAYARLGFPPLMAELHARALDRLPELLRDEVRIQDLLFSGTDAADALAAYQTNVFTDRLNARCAEIVRAAAPARIVELGGGTGRTTAAVLDALGGPPPGYVFTDVSRLFTVAAAERFGVQARPLDLNRPFSEQEFAPGSADVIVAGNVLHNAVHIGQTLLRIRDLLVPGGALVFTESAGDDPAVLTGMQFLLSPPAGTPVPRGGAFFLSEAEWRTELAAAGFTVADVTSEAGGQRLFHARTSTGATVPDTLGHGAGRIAVFLPDPALFPDAVLRADPATHPAKALALLEDEEITTAVLPAGLARSLPHAPAAGLTDLDRLGRVVVDGPLAPEDTAAWAALGVDVVAAGGDNGPDPAEAAAHAADAEIAVLGPDRGIAALDLVSRAALLSMRETVGEAAPRHRGLLRRWAAALDEHGPFGPDESPEKAWESAERTWREVHGTTATVDYARACARALPALLSGECDPVPLLFPEGRMDLAREIYREAVTARYQHRAVAALVAGLVARRGGARILEVGGGTGATTSVVLPALAAHRVDYLFTDVSRYFVDQARERFGDTVRYGLYDVDKEPPGLGTFDIVLAGGVLNAAADTDRSVGYLTSLLAPGGWLVLTEPTAEEPWVLTSQAFLLTEPSDARAGTGTTFLTLPQWNAVLDRAGLERALELPPPGHPLERLGHRIFGARRR